jgi:hypothetical protein
VLQIFSEIFRFDVGLQAARARKAFLSQLAAAWRKLLELNV